MVRKLLSRIGFLLPLVLLFIVILTFGASAQPARLEADLVQGLPHVIQPTPMPTAPASVGTVQEGPRKYERRILLWPRPLSQFVEEYASWPLWLEGVPLTRYAPRDELLVAVRAIASQVPDLTVETDEPASNLLAVSGNVGAVWALVERLRNHPLLARVTEDAQIYRDEARSSWAASATTPLPDKQERSATVLLNIRNNWAGNVVWGFSAPWASVSVALVRSTGHTQTTTALADAHELYHAYLAWEIRAGDVVSVADGIRSERITVPTLQAVTDRSAFRVSGRADPTSTTSALLKVVVARAVLDARPDQDGRFSADFRSEPFRAGDPGFVSCTDGEGVRTFQPFSVNIARVRRDTSWGRPYGDTHSAGISSIVWGYATADATLVITLTRPSQFVITRTITADNAGHYSASVDRLIEDGDLVEVSDASSVTEVPAVTLTYTVDGASKVIRGIAPPGITNTTPGAPHSLLVVIGGHSYPITTTAEGEFEAHLADNPYLAGLLGTMRYTTPEGDEVYKPLFAAEPLARGKVGDWRADVILGQPDFGQITPNEVVGNKLFQPMGVYVDRSVQPGRVYVYDSGNSRVLGLSHLGQCLGGANASGECTSNSDCPGSKCLVQPTRSADLVLGQPSSATSTCNGDSGYQWYPDVVMAGAATLCGLREEQVSIFEGGSGATMAADEQGNLYVPDFFNNRVVRYDDPFETDTEADYVWGQADFSGVTCNRGRGIYQRPDAKSLCLSPPPGVGDVLAGVALDSAGNLWVTDNENSRVLRFPFDPQLGVPAEEADLVLGQPDFSSWLPGSGLHQMTKPESVRVSDGGTVYVADAMNDRVLVFEPPLTSGMSADRLLGSGLKRPLGLERDLGDGIWVNDYGNRRLIHFVNDVETDVVSLWNDVAGGLGVDRDENVLGVMTGSWQEGVRFGAPGYTLDAKFLQSEPEGFLNQTGSRGLFGGIGLEVAAGQMIYADRERLLFWNDAWNLSDYQPATGFVGVPDLETRYQGPIWYGRMRADGQGRLWVLRGGISPSFVNAYALPLETGATPLLTVTSPLPLQGGGVFTWSEFLAEGGIDIQPGCDCLWLADKVSNRAFRIRDASSEPTVDVVLGQLNAAGMECNQGRGRDFPTQDSLCRPGALAFDRDGNLFVADHSLEVEGNLRLLEFDAGTIPNRPESAVFGIPATRVYGRNGSFTEPNCLSQELDPMCGPWEPAFDSGGRMAIGFNSYSGPRFPVIYQDSLTSPLPVVALADLHSMPLSARFDQFDNLYILDHNRSRVLIYLQRPVQTFTASGRIATAEATPISGVQIETTGYGAVATSDRSGLYALTGLITGTYEVIPTKAHYTFSPVGRSVTVPPDLYHLDFVGQYISTTVTITTPPSGTTVSGVVKVEVGGTGDWLELYIDGILHSRVRGPNTIWDWNTRLSGNGLHTLKVMPYDAEGLGGIPDSVTITVDNTGVPGPWLRAGLEGETVREVVIAPSDRRVIYAATTASGRMYRSVDAGVVWAGASEGLPAGAYLTSLAISPSDAKVAYVANANGGVYKTLDGGDSWHWVGVPNSVWDLDIAPQDEETVYAVGDNIYRTVDGAESWTPVLTGIWAGCVAIDPVDTDTVYAGGLRGGEPWVVYKTIDGGSTWTWHTVESAHAITVLVIDPLVPQTVYASAIAGPGGVYKSTDGGLTWLRMGPEGDADLEALAMAPSDSHVLYVGNRWGDVWRTSDGGNAWTNASDDRLPDQPVYTLVVDPSDPDALYAGLANSGLWNAALHAPHVYLPLVLRHH